MVLADSVNRRKALVVILTNEWHLNWLRAEESSGLEGWYFLLLNRFAHGRLGLKFQLVGGKAVICKPPLHVLDLFMQLSLLLSDSHQLAELSEELLSTNLFKARTALLLALGSQRFVDPTILDGSICGRREQEGSMV